MEWMKGEETTLQQSTDSRWGLSQVSRYNHWRQKGFPEQRQKGFSGSWQWADMIAGRWQWADRIPGEGNQDRSAEKGHRKRAAGLNDGMGLKVKGQCCQAIWPVLAVLSQLHYSSITSINNSHTGKISPTYMSFTPVLLVIHTLAYTETLTHVLTLTYITMKWHASV